MLMTVAEFQALYPQYASTSNVLIQLWLDFAASELGDVWDCVDANLKKQAHGLLAAHKGSSVHVGTTATSGPVTSQKVGDLAETYAQGSASATEDGLSSSAFGIEYSRLRKLLPIAPVWV